MSTMKQTKFTDTAPIGQIRDTADGYLVALSRVARSGVQDYLASELGLMGNHIVRVMRHPDDVFAKDAMSSLSHAPVTVDHPAVMVDAENWREFAVGEVGDNVLRDGEWLSVPLILKDAKGIGAARTTHKEISMGYTANLVDAPEGSDWDLEMKDIRFNHLAIVPKGRAGSEARIGDGAVNWGAAPQLQRETIQMDMKTIVVGDKAVQIAATDADIVTKLIADHKATIDAKDTQIGELKAECAAASAKVLTDAQIEARVADRVAVIDKAKTLVADYDASGKSVADIKREVVLSVYGADAAGVDVSDAEVNGIFRVMAPVKVDDSARDAIKRTDKKAAAAVTDNGQAAYIARLENAYKDVK
jgi:uncharacterized protein